MERTSNTNGVLHRSTTSASSHDSIHELQEIQISNRENPSVENVGSAVSPPDAESDHPDDDELLIQAPGVGSHSSPGSIKSSSAALSAHSQNIPIFRKIERFWRHGWIPEMLGLCLALLSLMATILVLQLHDGLTLQEWPLSITINALVSFLVILLKAGVAGPLSEGNSHLLNILNGWNHRLTS